jgi:hypothetical protein
MATSYPDTPLAFVSFDDGETAPVVAWLDDDGDAVETRELATWAIAHTSEGYVPLRVSEARGVTVH